MVASLCVVAICVLGAVGWSGISWSYSLAIYSGMVNSVTGFIQASLSKIQGLFTDF